MCNGTNNALFDQEHVADIVNLVQNPESHVFQRQTYQ